MDNIDYIMSDSFYIIAGVLLFVKQNIKVVRKLLVKNMYKGIDNPPLIFYNSIKGQTITI